jgi:hypothetical protein
VGVFNYKDIYYEMKELIRHILREHTKEIILEMPKALTQSQFLEKARKKHGDKFNYSKTVYKNSSTPIIVTCPIHGDLELLPTAHLNYDCKKCVDERFRKSPESFLKQAKEIHGDKYDYSKTKYTNANGRIIVTCPKHGDFDLRASHHLGGQGCKKCANELVGKKNSLTQEEFLDRARKIHGDKYDYSKVQYNGINNDVRIGCPIHGEFEQTPNHHLDGSGCSFCGRLSQAEHKKLTIQQFIDQSREVHGKKYDYSISDYNKMSDPVKIICPKHGDFIQTPAAHVRGQGCPICSESTGEKLVSKILDINEINYLKQHKFLDCTNQKEGRGCRKLPFDFYLPEFNLCVEFDGQQHFMPLDVFGGEERFNYQKKLDKIKDEYCKKNGIKLIRIPYTMNKEEIEPYILKELGIK